MDTIDIVLVIVFILIIFKLVIPALPNYSNKSNDSYKDSQSIKSHISNNPNVKFKYRDQNMDKLIQEIDDLNKKRVIHVNNKTVPFKPSLNPYVIDSKFHTDYRDVLDGFNNLVPSQKQIFNITNIPVEYTVVNTKSQEVNDLVTDFITALNNAIISTDNFRNSSSGWDENIQDPQTRDDSWAKSQLALGLQPSLYDKPKLKSLVFLVDILKAEKYVTDNERKFTVNIVLQKINTEDQMLLKASFVQDMSYDKADLERNFFKKNKLRVNKVIIEELDVEAYLSKFGEDTQRFEKDEFYNFDQLEKSDMLDNKEIARVLLEKEKARVISMQNRVNSLDFEGRAVYNIPDLDDNNQY